MPLLYLASQCVAELRVVTSERPKCPSRDSLMDTDRRDQIRRSLSSLADSYAATMELMEQTLSLLCEELALDPWAYYQTRTAGRPIHKA
jgi:hypothetical protein